MKVFCNTTPFIALSVVNELKYLGLNITGTLGILLKAKQQGSIASFADCARQMQVHGIRYNTALLRKLAKQVGEEFNN